MGYHEKYVNNKKTIHIIGMNCISEKRQINEWVEEIVDKTKEPTFLG
jgi:hemerythrin superfamily protein